MGPSAKANVVLRTIHKDLTTTTKPETKWRFPSHVPDCLGGPPSAVPSAPEAPPPCRHHCPQSACRTEAPRVPRGCTQNISDARSLSRGTEYRSTFLDPFVRKPKRILSPRRKVPDVGESEFSLATAKTILIMGDSISDSEGILLGF